MLFIHQNFIIETSHLKTSPSSCNVQQTSDTSKPLVFHPIPNSHENLKFINDLVDTESNTLCNLWVKYKQGSVANKSDFEKKPFCMNHKPTARVITQRSSKAATHYIDKLKNLLKKLEKHNYFEQNGFSPQQLSLNPLIIISNGNSIKCVFDARQLRSNTSNLMSHGLLNFLHLRELALAKHTTVILNSWMFIQHLVEETY